MEPLKRLTGSSKSEKRLRDLQHQQDLVDASAIDMYVVLVCGYYCTASVATITGPIEASAVNR